MRLSSTARKKNDDATAALMVLAACCFLLAAVDAWVVTTTTTATTATRSYQRRRPTLSLPRRHSSITRIYVSIPDQQQNNDEKDFMDVEFEKVEDVYSAPPSPTKRRRRRPHDDSTDLDNAMDSSSSPLFGNRKNLIDLSLETADPAHAQTRVPFLRGNECIDCKLAFTVDLEGQTYGIGVPFDDAVAIVVVEETKTKKSNKKTRTTTTTRLTNIDPDQYQDNDEYAELMEIFANQVQEQFGETYMLRKTPKVLTISGGLGDLTKNWERDLMPKPVELDQLLEVTRDLMDNLAGGSSSSNAQAGDCKDDDDGSDDPELQEFYAFMRKELGDKEFEDTMNQTEFSQEELDLLKFFQVPGTGGTATDGDNGDDAQGLKDLIDSISDDLENEEVVEAQQFVPNMDNTALKLLAYQFPKSGKSYSLVKLLQPYTLVGKLCTPVQGEDNEEIGLDSINFDLLSPEEEKILVPKLEELCRKDLEEKGLKFPARLSTSASKPTS